MKNSGDTIGNRTRNLPAKQTALPRAADIHTACYKYYTTRGNHGRVFFCFNFLKAVIKRCDRSASVEEATRKASFVSGAQMMYGLTPWKMRSYFWFIFVCNNVLAVLQNVCYFSV